MDFSQNYNYLLKRMDFKPEIKYLEHNNFKISPFFVFQYFL